MIPTYSFEVEVRRKSQNLPHYAIVPTPVVLALQVNGTTSVDVWLSKSIRYRRTLKKWREGVWFLEFTAVQCATLNLFAGKVVQLHMALAESLMPTEFASLLEQDPVLRGGWMKVSSSVARVALEGIRQGKKAETRNRRAALLAKRVLDCTLRKSELIG